MNLVGMLLERDKLFFLSRCQAFTVDRLVIRVPTSTRDTALSNMCSFIQSHHPRC